MPGGFTGAGAKTVIPAKATAKISFRLVPDMDPQEVFAQYKTYVESLQPKGMIAGPADPFRRPDRGADGQSVISRQRPGPCARCLAKKRFSSGPAARFRSWGISSVT